MYLARNKIIGYGVAIGAVAAVAYLALYDPTRFPAIQCPFHLLTGLKCPGCGTQRAVHALCAGDISAAWSFNPALFIALPLAALYAWTPRRLNRIMYAPVTLRTIVAAIILWWILRNTPAFY